MSDLFTATYNPDVLSCLANLSNDEVFTPPEVVNQMLDMLPEEIWYDKNATFLDPACKTGVFLREIAKRLIEAQLPNYEQISYEINEKLRAGGELDGRDIAFQNMLESVIEHVFKNQVFGIAITELTSLLSRRSVYCSKYPQSEYSVVRFDNPEGRIDYKQMQHTWKNGKCVYCGASESEYDREESREQYAYEFIHLDNLEEVFDMKFDVIIGNPPYHMSDGGHGPSAIPVYQKFVEQAKKLQPKYLSMIIPARWFAGGRGLDDFRASMLSDKHIRKLVDFESSKDCFEGVNIAGGICFFLWDRDNLGKCNVINASSKDQEASERFLDDYPIFIRSNRAARILKKVLKQEKDFMDEIVLSQKPFGFRTYTRGEKEPFDNAVKLLSSKGIGYVSRDEVSKNADSIDKWKVITGRFVPSNGELDVNPGEGYRVMTNPRLLEPGVINTESYITLFLCNSEKEALSFAQYMRCKLPRFLLRQAISSVNINREVFKFVPVQDFTQEWTDEKLYRKYALSSEDIEYIEYLIRAMDCEE